MKWTELTTSVATLSAVRLIFNMGRRFAYPFVPEIARQLSVRDVDIQTIMAANVGIGVSSPLFGPLAERYGRKRVMLGGLTLMAAGSAVGALIPRYAVFALVLIVLGVAKMIYDPAMQAYLGDRVPYRRRALALGLTELSWSGSLLIAPVAGRLLETSGLQSVFVLLLATSLIGLAAVTMLVKGDHPGRGTTFSARTLSPLATWRVLRQSPAALAALAFSFLISSANEIFLINYGVWMEASFALDVAAVGMASVVIAVAEVTGELAVIALADRWGKRRMALAGVAVASAAYIALALLSNHLIPALGGLFVLFVFFEIGIVASMPLFTEVLPSARSIMMSSNMAAHSTGRLIGALAGSQVYAATGSFTAIGLTSLVIGLVAAMLLARYVTEGEAAAEQRTA